MTDKPLADTIALVTGAGRGIGAATAKALAERGAHVVLTARSADELEGVEDAIFAAGGSATIAPLDLTETDSIARLATAVTERWGRLDALVLGAARLGTLAAVPAIDQRELPAVDEWREWLAIRRRYEQLASLAGSTARRLAWPKVRDDVCKLAVWLWNVRNEKHIAHLMFRWLLDEATALDDQEAIVLQKKNVDCGTG